MFSNYYQVRTRPFFSETVTCKVMCNVTMPSASLLAIPHLKYKREASTYKNRPCVGQLQSTTPKNSDVMVDHVIHILFIKLMSCDLA